MHHREPISPRAEALLFAADRAHHVDTVIAPALDAKRVVLCDRYIDSSLAYQGAGRKLSVEEIRRISRWATQGLTPDLTILLDISPTAGLARARGVEGGDKLEAESLQFHEAVRRAFLHLAEAEPRRYRVVDARRPVDVVAAEILDRGERTARAGERTHRDGAVHVRDGDDLSVWDDLIGQDEAVAVLQRAAGAAAAIAAGGDAPGGAMTHAWLFTGPAGSGRSVAARAFAAALQCERTPAGCGECSACHTVATRSHPDVHSVVPEGLSISVAEMRSVVARSARRPILGRWQVVVIEDADRLTEQASNALLKAVEEPPARTVFLLCVPSLHPDDVSLTIRSRCRLVSLRTPPAEAIAAVLRGRDGIDDATAEWAAAASQGHVGRARRLARDEAAREHRSCRARDPGVAHLDGGLPRRGGSARERGRGRGQGPVRVARCRRVRGAADRARRRRHRQGHGGDDARHDRRDPRSREAAEVAPDPHAA